MEKLLTPLVVVAAAIERSDGKILLHCRPEGKELSGCWEFPGGKVESGESAAEALARELREECGIAVPPHSFDPVSFETERRRDAELVLLLFHSSRSAGEARSLEGGQWDWFSLEQAGELPLAPLDRRLLPQFAAWQMAKHR